MPPPKRIMVSASDVAVDKRLYVSRQSESFIKSAYVSVTTINSTCSTSESTKTGHFIMQYWKKNCGEGAQPPPHTPPPRRLVAPQMKFMDPPLNEIIIKRFHHILNASLHYLLKPLCSKIDLISMFINISCGLSVVNLQTGLLLSSDSETCDATDAIW